MSPIQLIRKFAQWGAAADVFRFPPELLKAAAEIYQTEREAFTDLEMAEKDGVDEMLFSARSGNVHFAAIGILMRTEYLTEEEKGKFLTLAPKSQALPGLGKRKKKIPRGLWVTVILRDGECRICKSKDNLTCDHVIPESKGGATTSDNLQALCRSCNSRKGAKV